MILNAYAKINLSLDVLKRRSDGYHELQMIMQSVDLHDEVFIEKVNDSGIHVEMDKGNINSNSNIAYKAAEILLKTKGIKEGVKINIKKNIPMAAGLAGGSADAAAVLVGVNKLFDLKYSIDEIKKYGKEIGADVPYCIGGGTMLAEGIGEKLSYIEDFCDVNIVIVKPKIDVSTKWVYQNLNIDKISNRPNNDYLIDCISKKNILKLSSNMVNVLESVTIQNYPIIDVIKNKLKQLGAIGSMMSGSGPSVFGIFDDYELANKVCEYFDEDNEVDCFLTKTIKGDYYKEYLK